MTDPLSVYNVLRKRDIDPTSLGRAIIRFARLSDEDRAAELGRLESGLGDLELDEYGMKFLALLKALNQLPQKRREEIAANLGMKQLETSIYDRLKGLI